MKYLVIALSLASTYSLAGAQPTQEQIAQQLTEHNVVSGNFVQTRNIEGIEGGLRSNGRFVFWRNHGIYWATEHPVDTAVTYRNDKTLRWTAGSTQAEELENNAEKQIRRMLLTVFSFDTQQLDLDFEQQWTIRDENWALLLTPRQYTASRFLNKIVLMGKQAIESVSLYSANGEVLNIEFTDSQSRATLDLDSCIKDFNYNVSDCEKFLDETTP